MITLPGAKGIIVVVAVSGGADDDANVLSLDGHRLVMRVAVELKGGVEAHAEQRAVGAGAEREFYVA